MQFISSSVGPSTCTVFLSRVEVFLEGELGKSALDFIAPRGPSRFGQVNCWVGGVPPASIIPDELEKADLFVLVGSPEELHSRINELSPYLKAPSSIVLALSCSDPGAMKRLKADTGLSKIISIILPLENPSGIGLVLDSIIGLQYFYENALGRFTLFDLRHIWPDGSEVEVMHHLWPGSPDNPGTGEALVTQLTWDPPDLDSPHLLSVLRGPTALSDQVIEGMIRRLSPRDQGKSRFWYAITNPPGSPADYAALTFSAPNPNSTAASE